MKQIKPRKEVMDQVKKHRIDHLEQQIADAELTLKIYRKMCEKFKDPGDEQRLCQEEAKYERLQMAYETVLEIEGE